MAACWAYPQSSQFSRCGTGPKHAHVEESPRGSYSLVDHALSSTDINTACSMDTGRQSQQELFMMPRF